ncbi:hypothetical protein D6779_07460 [Candidatus Parcubacteria bacterium]|nr:MAG: hypothetical protein D6779_07460 [Candidatus Parcubacteria bacterium]
MRCALKPDGANVIYDFRLSHPRNSNAVRIGEREIRRLFPGMALTMRRVTLAPPLARAIAPVSPWLAYTLERALPFLRTHALYLLQADKEK